MRSVVIACAALIVSMLMATQAFPASSAMDRALALERQGKLAAALRVLEKAELSKTETEHRTRLGATVQTRAAAREYERLQDYALARSVLESQQKALKPLPDALIGIALARDLARVGRAERAEAATKGAKERADADEQALRTIAKARELQRAKEYEKAAAAFKSVASQPAAAVSADIRQRAAVGQIRAETAAAAQPGRSGLATFLGTVWDVVRDALKWALIIALVVMLGASLWLLGRWRRRRPVPEATTMSLTDLSGEGKDRNQRSYVLMRELRDAIDDVGEPAERDAAAEIEERRDLDGTPAPLVRVSDLPQVLESLSSESSNITIGPVKLNPLQLVYFFRSAMAKPGEYEMVGALRTDTEYAELTVERIPYGATQPDHRWKSAATGATARRDSIREVATKIAVDFDRSYVSSDWRSFKLYREALGGLETAQKVDADAREEALNNVAVLLTRSLGQDALNVLARFRLGTVLRALGRNADAARQFERVRDDVADPSGLAPAVRRFVERQPELYYVAAYNRAVAISKLPSDDRYAAGVELAILVSKLGDREPPGVLVKDRLSAARRLADPGLRWPEAEPTGVPAQRLFILSYAAWGSTLLSTVDIEEEGDDASRRRLRDRRKLVLTQLEAVSDAVRETAAPAHSLRAAARHAEAILDNARARIFYRQQRYAEARQTAERARAVLPDLGDASITLASIAMAPVNQDGDWVEEARGHLERALQISPKDPRALFLLGELLVHPAVADDDGAKEQFTKLPASYMARFRLGEIFLRANDLPSAVTNLALSQSQKESSDYRATALAHSVVDMATNGKPTPAQLDAATRAATRVRDAAATQNQRDDAVELIGQLKLIASRGG